MTLKLYNDYYLQEITDNIDRIEEEATRQGYIDLEPDEREYNKIKRIILKYIRNSGRLVYGGSAYHAIIEHYRKDKNEKDKIYKSWMRYDIEFYSPEPMNDVVKICNLLMKENVKYIMGKQAQHEETFTIFANFIQYCDISYMSSNVYDKMPYIEIEGVRYIHPEISLIDIFRMYNDPLTSYWRLQKVFKRMKLYMNSYDFDFRHSDVVDIAGGNTELLGLIFDGLNVKQNRILYIGQLAYMKYMNPERTLKLGKHMNQLEIVVEDEYVDKTVKRIKQLSNVRLEERRYARFFQFWPERVELYNGDIIVCTIYGNNGRCIPFNEIEVVNGKKLYKVNIGSYLVTLNYYLIGYYYVKVLEGGQYYGDRNFVNSLVTKRNEYLEAANKTPLDDTIYKEFIIKCFGRTMEFGREYLLKVMDKRKKNIRFTVNYDPRDEYRTEYLYDFDQTDGDILKN